MTSPQTEKETPLCRSMQDRQLGCASLLLDASVFARSPAKVVSFEPIRSAGIPRLVRSALIHFTSRPSTYSAVAAFTTFGWDAGPTAVIAAASTSEVMASRRNRREVREWRTGAVAVMASMLT